MENINITIIQSNLHWEDKEANLNMFSRKIKNAPDSTDLIILPEMFTTGFSMNAVSLAEEMNGETVNWMQKHALEKGCAITGSFICEENDKYYNRLVWVDDRGACSTYDKRHLFSIGDEHNHYTAGTKRLIVELKGWKICPMICYDLRFPVWSRNTKTNPYDVLIYVANWPTLRIDAWKTLLQARAIENQCYLAAVNRIGDDGNFVLHSGYSAVIDAKGQVICGTQNNEEDIKTVTLIYEDLKNFRRKFPVLDDAD